MPFTLAHPAAVLPLARGPLVPSALVLGSMVPDVPYYFSLMWINPNYNNTMTHHWASVLWRDPVIALVLLAVFHVLLKRPLVALLPRAAGERVWPAAEGFDRRPAAWPWIAGSAAVGAATHLAWDRLDDVFGYAQSPKADLFSGVLGLVVILTWAWRRWHATPPQPVPPGLRLETWLRAGVLSVLVLVAVVVGAVGAVGGVRDLRAENRLTASSPLPPEQLSPIWTRTDMADLALRTFAVDAVKTAVLVLALYAVAWHLRSVTNRGTPGETRSPVPVDPPGGA